MRTNAAAAERAHSVRMELSNEMVRLYKDLFGRGPTRARTGFAGPDTVICTLEDTLTPAERHMVQIGEQQRLRDLRIFLQHAHESDFRRVVERVTGRNIRGFVSGIDVDQDIAAEVFYLVPVGDGDEEQAT